MGILEIDNRLQNLSQRLGGIDLVWELPLDRQVLPKLLDTPQLVKESCKTATQPSGVTAS